MSSQNHSRTDSPAYSDYANSLPGGSACCSTHLTLCPGCLKEITGGDWICADCLEARCSDNATAMYEVLKRITNPNRWGKELASDIEAARTLCMQIEEGSR